MSRALRDIPAIRALAERGADAFHAAYADAEWSDARTRRLTEEAFLDLLADLRRPASRDAVARLVAVEMGIDVTRGALFGMADTAGRCFIMCDTFAHCWHIFDASMEERSSVFHGGTVLPALAGVTDPAEALAIIADAVLP